jgi:hypothetical protein
MWSHMLSATGSDGSMSLKSSALAQFLPFQWSGTRAWQSRGSTRDLVLGSVLYLAQARTEMAISLPTGSVTWSVPSLSGFSFTINE